MHPRISVSQVSSRRWTVEEDLAYYGEHGIDRIGVWLPKLTDADADPGTDADPVAAMAAAIDQITASDVDVTSVRAPNPFTLDDRSRWDDQAEQLSSAIDAAEALGCDTVVVPFGGGGALAWERSADALEEALVPTLRQAQRQGIWFLLEPTNSLCSDVSFVHTLRDALDLSWRLDTGVCMDITASWNERNLVGTVHSGVAGIGLVHVSDYAIGTHDTPNRRVPGDGDIPLERILGQLLETGYEGLFEVELLGPQIDAEGYAEAISRSVEWLDDLLTTLGAGPPILAEPAPS